MFLNLLVIYIALDRLSHKHTLTWTSPRRHPSAYSSELRSEPQGWERPSLHSPSQASQTLHRRKNLMLLHYSSYLTWHFFFHITRSVWSLLQQYTLRYQLKSIIYEISNYKEEFWTLKMGSLAKGSAIQQTYSHTCVKLLDLHLRLPNYDAAMWLTPERYHWCCQSNLGGLHDRTLLLRLQHLHKHTHTQNNSGQSSQCVIWAKKWWLAYGVTYHIKSHMASEISAVHMYAHMIIFLSIQFF